MLFLCRQLKGILQDPEMVNGLILSMWQMSTNTRIPLISTGHINPYPASGFQLLFASEEGKQQKVSTCIKGEKM